MFAVHGEEPISYADIRYGKVTLMISENSTYKCNSAPFSPPFLAKKVFVQLAPSRSSAMTSSLLQAVTVWLEWANSTGFAACVETSGRSDNMRVNILIFLAFHKQSSSPSGPEKFENGVLLWKQIRCFPSTLNQKNFKGQLSQVILDLYVRQTSVFKFLWFEEPFQKAPLS